MSTHLLQSFRQLYIISGNQTVLLKQIAVMMEKQQGDWLILTDNQQRFAPHPQIYAFKQAKQLLGQEFSHAIFDATEAFNLDAFAILSGTLVSGSTLILLLPETFSHWHDQDSLRWNESHLAITVPNFITHLLSTITKWAAKQPKNIFFNKINDLQTKSYLFDFVEENKNNSTIHYNPYLQQQTLFEQLSNNSHDVVLVTAKRGRGKSALAGMFAAQHKCWVTAPNQAAIATLKKFAGDHVTFYAPDELITRLTHHDNTQSLPDWLIIDEAAMIPLPMLTQLIKPDYHILLTTTIDGYEGTGQGLLLKLFNQLQNERTVNYYQLQQPIRWLRDDPLEQFTDQLLMIDDQVFTDNILNNNKLTVEIASITQQQLVLSPDDLLRSAFKLLRQAHYQTSLIDLRRLLDAPNLAIIIAKVITKHETQVLGTLLTIKEGGLPDDLIQAVWQGVRRPKGNLVAQSLIAHAGERLAGKLTSVRINRIAVNESIRRKGIARQLFAHLVQQITDKAVEPVDFISVSFAYSLALYHFWQKLGFSIVHIGSHQDARSGCYSAMAIYPLSTEAKLLTQKMTAKLARNWLWYQHHIAIDLPIIIDPDITLSCDDQQDLIGFATTFRAYEATIPSLQRLVHDLTEQEKLYAPILLALCLNRNTFEQIVKIQKFTGKKAVIQNLRQEVKQIAIARKWLNVLNNKTTNNAATEELN